MTAADRNAIVTAALARAPDWLRREFASDQSNAREAAEASLAATVIAALDQTAALDAKPPRRRKSSPRD